MNAIMLRSSNLILYHLISVVLIIYQLFDKIVFKLSQAVATKRKNLVAN